MVKLVITGGAGFIGSHIARLALTQGHHVTVIDDLSTGNRENLQDLLSEPGLHFLQDSILNLPILEKALEGADYLLHLAARTSVPESLEKPEAYFETNILGTCHLLKIAHAQGVKGVVFSSSAAVYGEIEGQLATESLAPHPLSPYAVSKLDGEYLLNIFRRQQGMKAVSLRYFNVYGPRQNPRSAYAAAVPIFIERTLRHQDLVIYGDGQQTRDFIFVEDVAKANLAACLLDTSGIINIASGYSHSIQMLAETLIDITGSRSRIVYQDARPGDIQHSRADNQKMRALLKLSPPSSLKQNLEKTIAYYERLLEAV